MIKKLLALFSFVTLLLIQTPAPLTIHGALTPPTSWDYAYKYNVTADEFQFTNYAGTNTNTPVYTRTADSTYYNYTYTGSGNGTLPFDVTLTFNRSNTSWKELGGGYTSDDTKIGSDNLVGAIVSKTYLEIKNLTNHDFLLFYDSSSTGLATVHALYINDINIGGWSSGGLGSYPIQTRLATIYIYGNSNMKLFNVSTTVSMYLDAFYLQDLGVSASYTAGLNDGIDSVPFDDINLDGYDDDSFLAGINEYMSDSLIKPLLYSPLNYTFMIGFFIYLILLFLSITFKNRIVFAVAGLFYFVPLSIFITDIWISLLSVIAIILHMTFAFFHDKKEEETI